MRLYILSMTIANSEPSILRQPNSWSRFFASRRVVESIFSAHRVFAEYRPYFSAFGTKFDEDERIQDGYGVRVTTTQAEGSPGNIIGNETSSGKGRSIDREACCGVAGNGIYSVPLPNTH